MIPLGLRLALSNDRQSRGRLIGTIIGLTLSTLLLLLLAAAINALGLRDLRSAWLDSADYGRKSGEAKSMLWHHATDYFGNSTIHVIAVDKTENLAPPPGLARWPKHDEYFLSPALARLIKSVPANQLGDRLPGKSQGLLGPEALASPDDLIAVMGTNLQMIGTRIQKLADHPREGSGTYQVLLAVEMAGIFFPLAIFVGTSCRLGAAQRERRFASLRLVGATNRQVATLAAIEALLGAFVGVATGIGMYFLLRPYAAQIPFVTGSFFPQDFTVPPLQLLALSLAVLLATVASALMALRRVQISPLGIVRRIHSVSPQAWRILPICAGFAALQLIYTLWGGVRGHVQMSTLVAAVTVAFLGVAAGIVIAGPWLTTLGGRLLGSFAGSASSLMAGRRLESHPSDIFRSVSGVVLGLFVCTTFTACLQEATHKGQRVPVFPLDTTAVFFSEPMGNETNASVAQSFLSTQSFDSVIPLFASPSNLGGMEAERAWVARSQFSELGLPGKIGKGNMIDVPFYSLLFDGQPLPQTWKSFKVSPAQASSLKLRGFIVRSKDDKTATEQLRTLCAQYMGGQAYVYSVRALLNPPMPRELASLQQLGYAGTIISILIAGCNLAVSVLGSVLDRRRSLGLLRLAGMPTSTLTQLVLLEGALPLLSVSLLSTLSGFAVAFMLTRIIAWDAPRAMPAHYYLIVVASLIFSLGILTATVPLMRRLTESGALRTE